MSNNAHELSNRLLNALDNNYNVVDMHTVNEIISILEKFNITKELLETTRLGKHVNELRRKTTEPTLARRAKVLVKRWRDLVIPTVASPGHTGSNLLSVERTVRRLGGTPLTSPALQRQGLSPLVPSLRPPSRPAWGGYESDSQDVILVDDDPPPPTLAPPPNNAHKPLTPPVKRPPSPEPLYDEKKAKRDKKPKKRRGHGRAGSGTESPGGITIPAPPTPSAAAPLPAPSPWRDRNGTTERRRNGCRKDALDPYTALVNRMPKVGDKKVKTTQELLEQIQSRGARPASPASPHSPDVMLIEPDVTPIKVDSPLRNGGTSRPPTPVPPSPLPPLEDEREYHECTCGEETANDDCPAARRTEVHPLHILALHHAYLPGINGTRAPTHPHQYAVRKPIDPEKPGLFTSIVPLYKYSDYADDYCTKNMSKVPLCTHLPWTEFAPEPPELPPPSSPPPLRPYPIDDTIKEETPDSDATSIDSEDLLKEKVEIDKVEAEMIGVPNLEPSERLKAPILSPEEETQFIKNEAVIKMEVEDSFETKHQDHRTVERTKEEINGQALFNMVRETADSIPYDYDQIHATPVVTLPDDEYQAIETLEDAMNRAEVETERDELERPLRPTNFTEWHECARLGELIALPYVVID